jgi:DNA repair exonuclease SbcCD ATPase subunit
LNNLIQSKPPTPNLSNDYIENWKQNYNNWKNDSKDISVVKKQYNRCVKIIKALEDIDLTKTNVIECDIVLLQKDIELFNDLRKQLCDLKTNEPNKCSFNVTDIEFRIEKYTVWYLDQNPKWVEEPDIVKSLLVDSKSKLEKINKKLIELLDIHVQKPNIEMPNGPLTVGTKEELEQLIKSEIHLKRTNTDIEKWNVEWTSWTAFLETVPSCNVDSLLKRQQVLRKQETELSEKVKEYTNMIERINLLTNELNEIKKIEYNPECHVCCKQPMILRMAVINDQIKELVISSKKLKKNIDKSESLDAVRAELQKINVMLPIRETYERKVAFMNTENEIIKQSIIDHELEDVRLGKLASKWWYVYAEWQNNVNECKKEITECEQVIEKAETFLKEYNIYNKECQDALNETVALDAYSEWNLKYDRISKEFDVINQKLYSLMIATKKKELECLDYFKESAKWESELLDIIKESELSSFYAEWEIKYNELNTTYKKTALVCKWQNVYSEWNLKNTEYAAIKESIEIEKKIELLKRYVALQNFNDLQNSLNMAKNMMDSSYLELIKAKTEYDSGTVHFDKLNALETAYNELTKRFDCISEFQKIFIGKGSGSGGGGCDGFKQYINKSVVYPLIEESVNRFISNIDDFKFKIKIRKSNIIYVLEDRGSTPTLDHASGYQKFIIGLGMRLTLSRLGALGQKIPYMFIDEGFVALDATNIYKTKDIIDLIKEIGDYQFIMMISHLDAIREVAELQINVVRPIGSKSSNIRVGKKGWGGINVVVDKKIQVQLLEPKNSKTEEVVVKKRGRPRKNV